jgi:uroporphyrin-III C-methyltransferase/precorrin-2 dehydrogenase/sirohydrochlorin ferrochelatase
LLEEGIDGATPLAVIERGTLESEHTVVTTLSDAQAFWAGIQPPAVIVIGPVVLLRLKLSPSGPDAYGNASNPILQTCSV